MEFLLTVMRCDFGIIQCIQPVFFCNHRRLVQYVSTDGITYRSILFYTPALSVFLDFCFTDNVRRHICDVIDDGCSDVAFCNGLCPVLSYFEVTNFTVCLSVLVISHECIEQSVDKQSFLCCFLAFFNIYDTGFIDIILLNHQNGSLCNVFCRFGFLPSGILGFFDRGFNELHVEINVLSISFSTNLDHDCVLSFDLIYGMCHILLFLHKDISTSCVYCLFIIPLMAQNDNMFL